MEFKILYKEEIEKLRKKELVKRISIVVIYGVLIWIISWVMSKYVNSVDFKILTIAFLCCCLLINMKILSKKYTYRFKKQVVKPIVLQFEEFERYEQSSSIDSCWYRKADFEEFEYCESNDYIEGKIAKKYNIEIYDIKVSKPYSGRRRSIFYETLFKGIFTKIDLPKCIKGNIKIGTQGYKDDNKKNKIEMDSSDFEKKFEVYADDKILAMQILTSDVMLKLNQFYEKYNLEFDISIVESNVFIRVWRGKMFEPKVIKSSMTYDELNLYNIVLQFIIDISEELVKSIEMI